MDNEPTKNENSDQSFLHRRGENLRSRQKAAETEKADAVNSEKEQAMPAKADAGKKQIPSFEEIIAKQQETMNATIEDSAADIDSDDEKSDDYQIDPLESLQELKYAVSKTEAELSSEEIDSLLDVREIDDVEEEYEINEDYSSEDSDEASIDAEDEMDALASLKDAIVQAQSQFHENDLNDDDHANTGSFHIGGGQDEHQPITPKDEKKIPTGQIPSFELAEKILTEERKMAAGRRTRNSGHTQKSDRSNITGIVGHVVRADRKAIPQSAESFSIAENITGDAPPPPAPAHDAPPALEDSQEQSSFSDVNDRYTPAVYSILRGDNNLTQIQRVIIADIVARDLEKQCSQSNSQTQTQVPV